VQEQDGGVAQADRAAVFDAGGLFFRAEEAVEGVDREVELASEVLKVGLEVTGLKMWAGGCPVLWLRMLALEECTYF